MRIFIKLSLKININKMYVKYMKAFTLSQKILNKECVK